MHAENRFRYGVDLMVNLADPSPLGVARDAPVPLNLVAEGMRISLSYVEVMAAALRRAGLVTSTRGPGGGYRLARPADQISLLDIATALHEAPKKPARPAPEYWQGIDAAIGANFQAVCQAVLIAHLISVPKKKAA